MSSGNPIADSVGNPIADASGNPRADNCCCDCVYHILRPCPDVAYLNPVYITHADWIAEGAPLIVTVDGFEGICFVVGGCVGVMGEDGVLAGIADKFATCAECSPSYQCAPNEDEEYTDEELEAMYPDLRVTIWGIRFCECYIDTPDDGFGHGVAYKIAVSGINGATFLLTPGPLYYDARGHCRNYVFERYSNPGEFNTLYETHYGAGACDSEFHDDNQSNDAVVHTATLCCGLNEVVDPPVSQWAYYFLGTWIADGGGFFGGSDGDWDGTGGAIASPANTYVWDSDCALGVGPLGQVAIGNGHATLFATAPGI